MYIFSLYFITIALHIVLLQNDLVTHKTKSEGFQGNKQTCHLNRVFIGISSKLYVVFFLGGNFKFVVIHLCSTSYSIFSGLPLLFV